MSSSRSSLEISNSVPRRIEIASSFAVRRTVASPPRRSSGARPGASYRWKNA
jgi:hypothetical protein